MQEKFKKAGKVSPTIVVFVGHSTREIDYLYEDALNGRAFAAAETRY